MSPAQEQLGYAVADTASLLKDSGRSKNFQPPLARRSSIWYFNRND